MRSRSVGVGRVAAVGLACAAVVSVAGCGGSSAAGTAVPESSTPVISTPDPSQTAQSAPKATAPSSARPGTAGGQAYRAVALTAAEMPPGYEEQKVTAEQALVVQQSVLEGATVTPPNCGTVGPITEQSVKSGLASVFLMGATQQGLAEFLAPAGEPALDGLASVAAGCRTVTITKPDKGLNVSGSVEVIAAPQVTADKTLGLLTRTTSVVAGSPPVTVVQTNYLAETNGTLVSINAKGGPTGAPVDPAVVAEVFTKAVQKVNAS